MQWKNQFLIQLFDQIRQQLSVAVQTCNIMQSLERNFIFVTLRKIELKLNDNLICMANF